MKLKRNVEQPTINHKFQICPFSRKLVTLNVSLLYVILHSHLVVSGEIASRRVFWLRGHTLYYLFVFLGNFEVILAKVFTAELSLE